MPMPSTDPSEVTLYKLTSELVLTGRGYPPDIEVAVRSLEDKHRWFSPDLIYSQPTTLRHKTLPVYHCVQMVPRAKDADLLSPLDTHKTERYFFAIEPALKKILETPFRQELRNAREAAYVERNKAIDALKQRDAKSNELATMFTGIVAFQGAPLYRRLWIALCPARHWPQAAKSTATQKLAP